MKKHIERFHYLTMDMPDRTHYEQAEMACAAGAKWIQYRSKNKRSKEEWLSEAIRIANLCDDWGTTLIVCSNAEVALKTEDAQGVHIEQADISVADARELLGETKVIGGSANNYEQVRAAYHAGADYVGLGPHQPTKTIMYSCNHVTTDDYVQILQQMKQEGIDVPIIAVGGIKPEHVDALLAAGVHGVAVCSGINAAEIPEEAFDQYYRKIY